MRSAMAMTKESGPAQAPYGSRLAAAGVWLVTLVAWLSSLPYEGPVRAYLYPFIQRTVVERVLDLLLPFLTLNSLTTIGLIIILRAANRRYGWLMLVTGFAYSVVIFTEIYSVYGLLVFPESELPLVYLAAWVQNLWVVPFSLLYVYLPLLFPDGRLPSSRWRPLFWSITLFLLLFVLVLALADLPLTNIFLDAEVPVRNPFGVVSANVIPAALHGLFVPAAFFLMIGALLAALASLLYRWRRASGERRQQLKWVLYFLGLLTILRIVDWVVGGLVESSASPYTFELYIRYGQQVVVVGLVAALGMTVLRYRLYDIDLIINRTLVYGALTAIIAGGYVLLVTALGAILPAEGTLLPSLLATGVVAALFAPLRERLQRGVNRLMFGERVDPYVVLSRLGQRLITTTAPEATLQAITETVATALKLPYVAIHLYQGDELVRGASHGAEVLTIVSLDLVHQNEVVGQLLVAPREPGESFAPRDRQLLADIAHHAGAVAHAVRLTAALQRSRQRLVTAREEERRRLRRDLHDGLGPTLASHTLKLDTAMELVHNAPDAAISQLQELHVQTQEIVADIRRLVHQLRPPALDDLGLVGALQAYVQQSQRGGGGPQISIAPPPGGLPPLPAAVELAAYRITMEALTNVVRHARAQRCQILFALHSGAQRNLLQIEISDDGRGLPAELRHGVGLSSMSERAEELGGCLAIAPGQHGGIQICAELPLPEESAE